MKKLSILVSGKGTNMQHILESISNGKLSKVKIDTVISDRYCKAIQYASKENITTFSLKKTKKILLSKEIDNIFIKKIPDIIVLCGFLSILDSEFCDKWDGKIINIHPSLLPKYGGKGMYGMRVHQKVINNKEKISGATVHYVTKNIDSGNIILKKSCNISSKETPISLSKKISIIEKEILIQYLNNI
ncbi:formyltransferase family protein [Blattabacterium punctulatus]|uniref:formyltransferase family protein n=1 Tax=Blattabacterium punctulatus TaxID=164514 RepID=UPI000D7CC743|nr:formyltransferase family protein [Blattabacterium punctulatus]AWU44427.1 phosphoribosylglycinamide formyltransferase [Blattabacterium punctulatus]AWU45510.1 phosphoribosylglycinamide formyltransferase [Blattabacterium punctulatus]